MLPPFTAAQQRVLGVLMEKALSNPGAYPLTLNAVTVGCNQKNNRDPLVEYAEGDVAKVLHELMLLDLVTQAMPAVGARVNRFRHETERKLGWGPRQQGLMAELLLRGPQTLSDLRIRVSRMNFNFDLAGVQSLLDELAAMQPPFVISLSRLPGQSVIRWTHTIGGSSVRTESDDCQSVTPALKKEAATETHALDRASQLEAQVASIQAELDTLRARIEALESR